jgi:hypothetical protein
VIEDFGSMSLRKSPTMTPARLAANRQNALKSTGPRTAQGKAQSRLNALRSGVSSPIYLGMVDAFLDALPNTFERTAALLSRQLARHPLFAEAVEMFRTVEAPLKMRRQKPGKRPKTKKFSI